MKKYTVILLLTLVCLSCHAYKPHRHYPHRHYPVVVVANRAKPSISNRFSSRDRMNMALAYLNNNKKMSISIYSKMTGLSKATAEAELDAFSLDKKVPIGMMLNGKKKVYVLTT